MACLQTKGRGREPPDCAQCSPGCSSDSSAQVNIPKGSGFPHETPTDHWDINFGDSEQVYQGTDLPVWILAGWAAFIIWAVVYLISGLPTFHY
ncbi:MAG: hypothetical protein HC875_09450 [Anaerolineales bacterium]|nr:hypothetical protein [Anaerolineales bacterium]